MAKRKRKLAPKRKHSPKHKPPEKLTSQQFTARLKSGKINGGLDRYLSRRDIKLTRLQSELIRARAKAYGIQERRQNADLKRARAARDLFNPQKKDRGRLIEIGPKGQRNPKGVKYVIHITRSGKKRLHRLEGDRPYSAHKHPVLKRQRNLSKVEKEFTRSKLVVTGAGTEVLKGKGSVSVKGPNDFSDTVISKLARSLKKTIEGQRSQRSFLIEAKLLIRHADKTTSVVEVDVPIARADNIAIKLAGIKNFVREKFYAFFAKQLQYLGYITQGSANHIARQLDIDPADVGEEEWQQYHDASEHNIHWSTPRFEVVRIEAIDWRINQAK